MSRDRSTMPAKDKFDEHVRDCSQCWHAKEPAGRCNAGQTLANWAARELEDDQRSVDQRTGRTYREVESTKKDIAAEAAAHGSAVWLGAWLALCWVLDDDVSPLPLRDRLRNAGPIP